MTNSCKTLHKQVSAYSDGAVYSEKRAGEWGGAAAA